MFTFFRQNSFLNGLSGRYILDTSLIDVNLLDKHDVTAFKEPLLKLLRKIMDLINLKIEFLAEDSAYDKRVYKFIRETLKAISHKDSH